MSTLKAEVVFIELNEHPNADTLSLVKVKGWQVVVKTEDFKNVKLGAYIPVDSILPQTDEWEFLRQHKYRVRTIKLRGMISQGLLIPHKRGWIEGQDVTDELKIQKYEPPIPVHLAGDTIKHIQEFPKYTDIENWKNYPDVFQPGDPVDITEKLHGTNFRCGIIGDKFCVGSHTMCKDLEGKNIYSRIAREFKLEEKLREANDFLRGEDIVYFGEIFGKGVQDLRYDLQKPSVACFDIWVRRRGYLAPKTMYWLCTKLGLDDVPILFKGDFKPELLELAEGRSSIAEHIKEGIVIKSLTVNDSHPEIGRKVLKVRSEAYELRYLKKKRKKHIARKATATEIRETLGIGKPTEYH